MIGVEKIVVRIDWLSEKQRYDYISARQPVLKIMTLLKGVIFIASLTVMKSRGFGNRFYLILFTKNFLKFRQSIV